MTEINHKQQVHISFSRNIILSPFILHNNTKEKLLLLFSSKGQPTWYISLEIEDAILNQEQ